MASNPVITDTDRSSIQERQLDLIDLILSRRSTSPKWLIEPGPTQAQIERMIAAAVAAPDHECLCPWRFLEISGVAREALADVFAEAKRLRSPGENPEEVERERERGRRAPVTLAVIARLRRDLEKVPVRDQYASVGAAIQNILLSAHAMGFGAKTLSGAKVNDPFICEALRVGPEEELVCFICMGTPADAPKERPRPSVAEHLTRWTGAGNKEK